jgi:hypothetical protein
LGWGGSCQDVLAAAAEGEVTAPLE